MKGFFGFIVYCVAAWFILMGVVYIHNSDWLEEKADSLVSDFSQSYSKSVGTSEITRRDPLQLVGNVSMTSSSDFGYYTYYFEGILKNVSGKRLDYAQVSFVIYDMAGNNIGSAFDNVNYIDANGTWKFKAMYYGEEPNIRYSTVPEISAW